MGKVKPASNVRRVINADIPTPKSNKKKRKLLGLVNLPKLDLLPVDTYKDKKASKKKHKDGAQLNTSQISSDYGDIHEDIDKKKTKKKKLNDVTQTKDVIQLETSSFCEDPDRPSEDKKKRKKKQKDDTFASFSESFDEFATPEQAPKKMQKKNLKNALDLEGNNSKSSDSKKKRKEELKPNRDSNQNEVFTNNDQMEGSTKKKKRKHADLQAREEDNLQSPIHGSPLKKMKKGLKTKCEDTDFETSMEELVDNEETEENQTSFLESPAKSSNNGEETEEEDAGENKILLRKALEQVPESRKPYNIKQLQGLDYQKIAECVENKTEEECRIQIQALISRTFKTKCFHQILNETLEEVDSRRNTISKFSAFIKLNKDKISEGMKQGVGSNQMAVAAILWKNLSDDEQAIYINKSSKAKDVAHNQSLGKTPFDVFYKQQKKKDSNIAIADARKKWTDLKVEKKCKFIKKSMEIMNELVDSEDVTKIRGPAKADLWMFFRHLGVPEAPPKLPALMYYKQVFVDGAEQPAPNNYLFIAIKTFKELSPEEQEKWTESFKRAWKTHQKELATWKSSQDDLTNTFYTKMFEKTLRKGTGMMKGSKNQLTKRQINDNLNKVEMPLRMITKFKDEPTLPPLTPLQLFSHELEKKTMEKLTPTLMKERFLSLDKTVKKTLTEKAAKIKETFIEGLKSFVGAMAEDQRRLFLGMKRVRYINLLAEDIFAKDYPDSQYPVYVLQKREAASRKTPKNANLPKLHQEEENAVAKKALLKTDKPSSDESNSESDEPIEKPKAPSLHRSLPKQVPMDSESESDEAEELEAWMNSSSASKKKEALQSEEEMSSDF